jgi:type IV secretory pathway VirB2 component (pilin)
MGTAGPSAGMAAAPPPPMTEPLPEPLRLPRGSVRGLMALILLVTYGVMLLRSPGAVPTVVVNTVVVIIAFYFGSSALHPTLGGGVGVAPARPRLVPALLFVAFAGLAGWFLYSNPSLSGLPTSLLQIWEVLGGYVAGRLVSWVVHRRAHKSPTHRRLATAFRDVSAAGALVLTGYIAYSFITQQTGVLAGQAEQILSLAITYYFGSRVIAH